MLDVCIESEFVNYTNCSYTSYMRDTPLYMAILISMGNTAQTQQLHQLAPNTCCVVACEQQVNIILSDCQFFLGAWGLRALYPSGCRYQNSSPNNSISNKQSTFFFAEYPQQWSQRHFLSSGVRDHSPFVKQVLTLASK